MEFVNPAINKSDIRHPWSLLTPYKQVRHSPSMEFVNPAINKSDIRHQWNKPAKQVRHSTSMELSLL